ncbi:hypothetical protein N5V81_13350 [Escherichia coli]|nr:hypothetical protein [Escherichia coli]
MGKATNRGVTELTAREYGYKGDMRDLSLETALDIYNKLWWQRMRLDQIMKMNVLLADRMFDFGINAGRGNCIKSLQRILNVLNRQGKLYDDIEADGGIGPRTLTALEGFIKARGEEGLNRLMFANLSSGSVTTRKSVKGVRITKSFTYGWYGRVYQEMPDYAAKLGMCK